MADLKKRNVPRWAQLTYTSSDGGAGRGGWGVKQSDPALSAEDARVLTEGVATRLHDRVSLAAWPTGPELEARSRRLMVSERGGTLSVWHSVSAGSDATGRPGNVFTHAARGIGGTATMRAIELWRSPDWLVPFGRNEVTSATLPGDLRPGGVVTVEGVIEFLVSGEDPRLYSLEWILDAVAHAHWNEKTAVLACRSDDEAALWIGAIAFLTSASLARRIDFATFERADQVPVLASRGVRLVCVPQTDLADMLLADPGELVLLDPTWELEPPEDSGSWRLPTGQQFPATRWRQLAFQVVQLESEDAVAVLAAQDDFDRVATSGTPFHWPLSAALLAKDSSLFVNRNELLEECLREAPAPAFAHATVQALLAELIEALGLDHFSARHRWSGEPDLADAAEAVLNPVDPETVSSVSTPVRYLPGSRPSTEIAPDVPLAIRSGEVGVHAAPVGGDEEGTVRDSIGMALLGLYDEYQPPSAEAMVVSHCIAVAAGYGCTGKVPEQLFGKVWLAAAVIHDLSVADATIDDVLEGGSRATSAWRALTMRGDRRDLRAGAVLLTRVGVAEECRQRFDRPRLVDPSMISVYLNANSDDHLASVVKMVGGWPKEDKCRFVVATASAAGGQPDGRVLAMPFGATTFGEAVLATWLDSLDDAGRVEILSVAQSALTWLVSEPALRAAVDSRLNDLKMSAATTASSPPRRR